MIESLDHWREELHQVDTQLVALLQRRIELAMELLDLLRTGELSLGDLDHDTMRLGLLLWSECEGDFPPLDDAAVKKIFRRIINETKRLTASSTTTDESKGG